MPQDILRLPPESLENRQVQARLYDTTDEEKMMAASSGVLQDLGFTLENSEEDLGLLVASKEQSAVSASQVTAALLVDVLSAFGGTNPNTYGNTDHIQKLLVAVVTKPSLEEGRMQVRVTFQRMIWNRNGLIKKIETLSDPQLYQDFFAKLSKSIFLEEHKI